MMHKRFYSFALLICVVTVGIRVTHQLCKKDFALRPKGQQQLIRPLLLLLQDILRPFQGLPTPILISTQELFWYFFFEADNVR